MTTPQSILNMMEYKVRNLCEVLEGGGYFLDEEGREDIVTTMQKVKAQNADMIAYMEKLENQMNLIINLLGKNEKN